MARPTVHDVANEAGVSLATVDRVMNRRTAVREKTAKRVLDAIERLGYIRDTSAANLARQREYRFAILLPDDSSQFNETLKNALLEAAEAQAAERISVRIVTVPPGDAHAVARSLHQLQASQLDGIAITAPEAPQVRDAINRLKRDGVAVTALLSDLPSSERDYFVGINSVSAGRTAAHLMGKISKKTDGKILAVTNSMISRDNIERRLGFDEVMLAEFPSLTVMPSVETHNDPERTRSIIHRVVFKNRDLLGVYSMGPSNRYLIDILRETGRLKDIVYIGHEITPHTTEALQKGEIDVIIAQNAGHLARSTLRVLRAKCDNVPIFEAQEQIRIDIITRENIP